MTRRRPPPPPFAPRLLLAVWGASWCGLGGCVPPDPPGIAIPKEPADAGARSIYALEGTQGRYVSAMALSEDYIYFVAWQDGLYRVPKYGGTAARIEQDAISMFPFIAACADTVFWIQVPHPSPPLLPHASAVLLRKQRIGEHVVNLLALTADVPEQPLPFFPELQLTATNVFFNIGESATIHRLPVTGGTATSIELPNQRERPSWVADDTHVYYLPPQSSGACAFRRIPLTGGVVEELAPCPTAVGRPWLVGIDATDAYVASPLGFWKIPKQGGTPVALFATAGTDVVVTGVAVADEQNLYFVLSSGDRSTLASIPKAGGQMTTILDDLGRYLNEPYQLAQDARSLFLLDATVGIQIFPKSPAR